MPWNFPARSTVALRPASRTAVCGITQMPRTTGHLPLAAAGSSLLCVAGWKTIQRHQPLCPCPLLLRKGEGNSCQDPNLHKTIFNKVKYKKKYTVLCFVNAEVTRPLSTCFFSHKGEQTPSALKFYAPQTVLKRSGCQMCARVCMCVTGKAG